VLHVFAPASLPSAVLEGPGERSGLAWDPLRRALYTADVGAGRVRRFTFDGQAWTRDTWEVPGVQAIGLTPDLTMLVGATGARSLWILDLASQRAEVHAPVELAGVPAGDLAITNDGRVWLVSWGFGGCLGWFDLRGRSFSQDTTRCFDGPPGYSVSRDGERLLISGLHDWPPYPVFHWLDASSGVVNMDSRLRWFGHAAQSDDGSRVAIDASWACDGDRNPLSYISAAEGWQASSTGAFSPDGRRFYRLELQPGPSAPAARVTVHDTTGVALSDFVPVVGTFGLPDDPACGGTTTCNLAPRVIAAPDGQTLFVDGGRALLVVPIASEYR